MSNEHLTPEETLAEIRARASASITEIVGNPAEYYRAQQLIRDRAALLTIISDLEQRNTRLVEQAARWRSLYHSAEIESIQAMHENCTHGIPVDSPSACPSCYAGRQELEAYKQSAPSKHETANTKSVNQLMVTVQEFASAWALIGGRFDSGKALEDAERLRAELRADIVRALQHSPPPSDDYCKLCEINHTGPCVSNGETARQRIAREQTAPPNSALTYDQACQMLFAYHEAIVSNTDSIPQYVEAFVKARKACTDAMGVKPSAEPSPPTDDKYQIAIGALSDIAISEDMDIKQVRNKAARICAQLAGEPKASVEPDAVISMLDARLIDVEQQRDRWQRIADDRLRSLRTVEEHLRNIMQQDGESARESAYDALRQLEAGMKQ